jgi:hypothetical protein
MAISHLRIGIKIYFTGLSDKMSDDVEFGSDICPMTFSSFLTRHAISMNDTNEYQHNVLILNGKCCEDIK